MGLMIFPNEDEDDIAVQLISGVVMLLISTGIFFFYAQEQYGIFFGILYSLFWYVTVPIHLIFF